MGDQGKLKCLSLFFHVLIPMTYLTLYTLVYTGVLVPKKEKYCIYNGADKEPKIYESDTDLLEIIPM